MADSKYIRIDFLKITNFETAVLTISEYNYSSNLKYDTKLGLQLYTTLKAIVHNFDCPAKMIADIRYHGIDTLALLHNNILKHISKYFNKLVLKFLVS